MPFSKDVTEFQLFGFKSFFLLFVCLQGALLEEPLWAPNDMQVDDLLMIIKVGRSVVHFGILAFALSLKSNRARRRPGRDRSVLGFSTRRSSTRPKH